jgi:methionyl-tRNA formyltransferase
MSVRVIFLGEKPLGLRCLRYLFNRDDIDLMGVCTRRKQGVWWGFQGVRDFCERNRIPIIRRAEILNMKVDVLISVLYPFIIEDEILRHARRSAVNLHEAPLPRWRGCNGYAHAILEGDAEYGTTIHELASGLDTGGVISERRFAIKENETVRELYERTTEMSYGLAKEWFPKILKGGYRTQPERSDPISFLHSRDSLQKFKKIPMPMGMDLVFRRVRALDFVPWEPAYIHANGRIYYLFVHGSSGRVVQHIRPIHDLGFPDQLSDIEWDGLDAGIIRSTPRPMILCEQQVYMRFFPLYGGRNPDAIE